MPLYEYRGKRPVVAPDAWIAPTACLVGDVTVGSRASVWFNATIRADTDRIEIGPGSNVQDNSVLHADEGAPTIIGANVTIGHAAIVHSSVVEDNVLIGSGAALVGGNRVGSGTIVGAGAVLPAGMQVGPRKVVLGVPGKVVRDARAGDERWTVDAARTYVAMSAEYRDRATG